MAKLTKSEAIALGLKPYYVGYYRESAKYKTEWFGISSSFCRKKVRSKLDEMIKIDRLKGFYGSRVKIVVEYVKS